ncbi:unnamed protein product [Urochloa decumbens]|uniref:F-box domain-containing protein n=1 Tax=Urochloa decumbens TaxID=240449 RepID=A0ABC9AWR3_9POAL
MQIDRTTGAMPPTKVRKKSPPRRLGIGDLPDDALQRVCSFLPAQETVRTCVLARRWRHTWRSAAGLIILCGGDTRRKFADRLLRARGATPVDTCEFRLLELEDEDVRHIDVWIRHVLQCKVHVLRINNVCIVGYSWEYPGLNVAPPMLSEAQNLALIAHHGEDGTRDLEFYPTFNKLKTLLLNEYWCEPPDFSALASLLEHSPVLEKLTLQLYSEGPKHNVEIKLSCKPMEKSAAISEHLSTVEIKCEALDERVFNVLKFLGKLNIWFQFS